MSTWTEGALDRGATTLHFHRAGTRTKPTVVLVHGFGDDGRCWARVTQRLERDFDIVMTDARNHGASGRGPDGPSELADDLVHLVTKLGLDRPALVGHSIGARTVADVAAAHPELVSRVVLEDPPFRAGEPGSSDQAALVLQQGFLAFLDSLADMPLADVIEFGRTTNPEWHEDEFPAWAAAKRRVGSDAVAALVPTDWKAAVTRVRCPGLLIHGEPARGGLVTPEVAREIEQLNPLISAMRIAGAGHSIRREKFDAYVDAVRAFLDDV